jgi:predicted GTPase
LFVVVVANKIDLEPERVLSREICHRFVKEHDALFLEVSAKSQEKIHDIMSEMVRKYRQIDVRAGAERLRERNTAANHGKSKCIII